MDFIINLLSEFDSAVVAVICVIILFIIFWFIWYIIKNRKQILEILNQWFDRKTKRNELLQMIYDSKNRLDEYAENRIHDREQSLEIQKQLTDAIQSIYDKLDTMQSNLTTDKIENMRWKILEFANDLINGKTCYKEQFDNILKTYGDYEKILEENNMTNGQVEESMKFIKEQYHELIEHLSDKNDHLSNN